MKFSKRNNAIIERTKEPANEHNALFECLLTVEITIGHQIFQPSGATLSDLVCLLHYLNNKMPQRKKLSQQDRPAKVAAEC